MLNRVYDVMRPGNNGSRARLVRTRAPRFATGGKAWCCRPDAVTTRPDAVTTHPDAVTTRPDAIATCRGALWHPGGIPGDTRGGYRLTQLQLWY